MQVNAARAAPFRPSRLAEQHRKKEIIMPETSGAALSGRRSGRVLLLAKERPGDAAIADSGITRAGHVRRAPRELAVSAAKTGRRRGARLLRTFDVPRFPRT